MSPNKRSDRCANPYKLGSHSAKNLRKVSNSMLKKFPNLSSSSKMCTNCRSMYYKKETRSSNTDDSTVLSNLEESISDIESDSESPRKKQCLSRESELENLLDGLKQKFKSLPANDPLRVSILTIAPDCWPERKVVKEFGASRRIVRKAKELKKAEGVLAMPTPKTGKIISHDTVQKVIQFYELDKYSRIMPNKKDTVTVKKDGKKDKVQKRLLLCDICNLHEEFKKLNPENAIGLTKFAELRPKWCILAGEKGTHTVCVCTIHENFKNMLDASNLKKLTENLESPIQGYKDCLEMVLCKNPQPDCYLNQCKFCPDLKKFSDYVDNVLETNDIEEVMVSTWQKTDRCTLKRECLSTEEFVDKLSENLQKLIPHHFIANSQCKYVKERIDNLKENEVLMQMDFSENYAYKAQDAAQAFHFNNNQCTVFPVACYYKSGNEIKHESFIFLSDSKTHDTAAVYLMQQNIIPEIKKFCSKVNKIIYVTDGAKQHFKNRFQMCNLVHHYQDFGIIAEWHCHATAHGKCVCDGLGATFKREASRASLQAKSTDAILTPESLLTWGKKHFPNIKLLFYSEKCHTKMQKSLAKRFKDAPRVKDIQNGPAFIVDQNKVLKVKKYSDAKSFTTIMQY